MNPQAMADLFAKLAKPRLMDLLRLKSVEHIYDPTPGRAPAKFLHKGREISLDKLQKTSQPYKDIHRFVSEDRVQAFILDPGLLPAVKSILIDVRGRRLLATRKVGPKEAAENAAVSHLDGFGMRIVLRLDPSTNECTLGWECLYGVE
jgi:hypothetical protein